MNIHEVARYLGMSVRTVYRLVKKGDLRAYKVGSVWRFSKQDLDAMLARLASREPQD
jgi:PTS system nitrogen regulatory IIA component